MPAMAATGVSARSPASKLASGTQAETSPAFRMTANDHSGTAMVLTMIGREARRTAIMVSAWETCLGREIPDPKREPKAQRGEESRKSASLEAA